MINREYGKLVSWLVLLKIVRKLNFLYGSIFGDIRLRDIGMIELFIVDKKVIRDDICF